MKITTYFFKVMVLLALSGPVCAATANYEIVPLPQQIVMQKGGPFVLWTVCARNGCGDTGNGCPPT